MDGLSAITFGSALINLPDQAIRASELYVSGSLFSMLGARAQLGRLIGPGDDRVAAPAVVLLSDAFWRKLVEQRAVTPGFWAVTKQRLVDVRFLTASDDDRPEAPLVVVVNQALAKRDFPDRSPVGMPFHTSDTTFATIVGVVSDIRNAGPVAPPQPEMYYTYRQRGGGSATFPIVLRARTSDPAALAGAVSAAIRRVDPTAAVADVTPMTEVIAHALGRPRFYFSLLGSFAGVAVILAIAGLYGVLSYSVAQRTREIGIRAALGSSRGGLVRLVGWEGGRIVAGGIAVGLVGGAVTTRLLTSMLYGVSLLDAAA